MKRQNLIKLLLFFLLLPLFTACTENELINDSTNGEILPALESLYQDGSFKAATKHYDGDGYGQVLELLVENKTITKVYYQEINSDGLDRLNIEGSDISWEGLTPLNLGSLYSKLYNDLLMGQSTTGINAVTGATKSSDIFKLLSQGALNASLKNDSSIQLIDTESTYTAKSRIDAKDNQGILIANFSGERLMSLTFDEINLQNNTLRSKSNELINGISYAELFDTFTRINLDNQNLQPIFNNEILTAEEEKYHDCLDNLRAQRVNFNAS